MITNFQNIFIVSTQRLTKPHGSMSLLLLGRVFPILPPSWVCSPSRSWPDTPWSGTLALVACRHVSVKTQIPTKQTNSPSPTPSPQANCSTSFPVYCSGFHFFFSGHWRLPIISACYRINIFVNYFK